MTPNPIVISGTTSITHIENIFKKNKIWSILVGDSRKYIGIITRNDLKNRRKFHPPSAPAYAIMSNGVYSIEQEEDINKAIAFIREKNINSLAVTKNGVPCGIITRYDIRKRYNQKIFDDDYFSTTNDSDHIILEKDSFPYREDEKKQRSFSQEQKFFNRLTNALKDSLLQNFIDPLKGSYHNDPILFIGLCLLFLGMLGITLIGILFIIIILFFQQQFNPTQTSQSIEVIIFLIFGGFVILTAVGSMIIKGKHEHQSSLKPIIKQSDHPIPDSEDYHSIHSHQFEIALSFSGYHRDLVEQVANGLAVKIGKINIFYDFFYRAHLSRLDLDLLLQKIYKNNSKLNVIFLTSDYDSKEWCGIEFRAIRELIKTKQTEKIMLLKLDDVDIEGIFSHDGYLDIRGMNPEEIVNNIIERLRGIPVGRDNLGIETFVGTSNQSDSTPKNTLADSREETKKTRSGPTRSIRDITRDTRRLR
ncbi:MAG: hypothetical protein CVV32_00415 [Methanomicrobiales archaeon HGW-Methanomicrobiales-3]|nr:MAG: hypothetical protein CVV32_00415 [Methanomicrobiales archaeon HGW-Methanomicrobiales-3]